MERLVQILFGHERAVFTNGDFSFAMRPHPAMLVVGILVLLTLLYLIYFRSHSRLSRKPRAGLVALRTALFGLLVFLLLRPVVVVPSVIPRSSAIALLTDDSRSMQIADGPDGRSRLEGARNALFSSDSTFLNRLRDKFKVDLYGFANDLIKIKDGGQLYGEGNASDLGRAMSEAARRPAGVPLSALVLMSDGAANVPTDLAAELRNLRARNLPVYTVGVGSAARATDAEMVRISIPRRVLVGSSINVEAFVRLSGFGATKVLIAISEDGRALKTEEFNLRGGETEAVQLELVPNTSGAHRYTFEITPLEGEMTVDNNRREAMVEVIEGPMRVLYVEGEPRWEHGKLRSALTRNEKNVELISVLRTGENKLYRQGVSGERELIEGFPRTEEELFAYHGLVLGSVEASFFSVEQMRSIEAFVGRRGGGLLALGGRQAFDGGKYAGTPVADVLPLTLNNRAVIGPDVSDPHFKPTLTARGATHPITRLNEDRAVSHKIWNELPEVSIPETLEGLKPGATVLVEARQTGSRAGGSPGRVGATVPLLAHQRYGRGHALAFTASDTWRWQLKMDSKSNAHETFWRQMLRYLVSISPDQTMVASENDVYALGDPVRIAADVRDKKFFSVDDARVTARVIKPSGTSVELPLNFTARDNADVYVAEYKADELGRHQIELTAIGAKIGSTTAHSDFLVAELNREFYDAAQNEDLLRRIAAETGGKYYTLDQLDSLVDDLTYRKTDNSQLVTVELWDMPINFLLLVGLVSGEWFLRKREGLA
jgi:hypothetical protein